MESPRLEGEVFYSAVPPSVLLSPWCLFFKQVGLRFSITLGEFQIKRVPCLFGIREMINAPELLCVVLFLMRFVTDCDALTHHCTLHLGAAWQFVSMRRLLHLYF